MATLKLVVISLMAISAFADDTFVLPDFPPLPDDFVISPKYNTGIFSYNPNGNFTPQDRTVFLRGCPRQPELVILATGDSLVWRLSKQKSKKRPCGFRFRTSKKNKLSVKCSAFFLDEGQQFSIAERKSKQTHLWLNTDPALEEFNTEKNQIVMKFSKINTATKLTCRIKAVKIVETPADAPQCSCGQLARSTRIMGGSDAEENEFSYQVGLVVGQQVLCSGSLIDEKWIVTSAHCTEKLVTDNGGFQVLVGGHQVLVDGQPDLSVGNGILVSPKNIIQHPQYNERSLDNDISLVEIDPLDLSLPQYGAVCLPQANENFEKKVVTLTGWGTDSYEGNYVSGLQKAVVYTLDTNYCSQIFQYQITKNMICAFGSGKDSCGGDAGAPLVTTEGNIATLAGQASWGYQCGVYPSVYTAISRYVKWIAKTAEGFYLC